MFSATEMVGPDQDAARRHVAAGEKRASSPSLIDGVAPASLRTIAVVGGGLMGAGIAACCLIAGLEVVLIEHDHARAGAARKRVLKMLEGASYRGKIGIEAFRTVEQRLSSGYEIEAATAADLAIEAVFEDLELKRAIFKNLARHLRPDALLATNTSYLDPNAITEGIAYPQRCLGLHFFSPAHVMKLLEIVRLEATDIAVLATAFAFAKTLGKIGVLAGITEGFIGNRMLKAYRRQADYLLADGALPHEIDAAMRAFGMPMGPYELQDLTGLQIAFANRRRQGSSRDPDQRLDERPDKRDVDIIDRLHAMGRHGQRSGLGWYRYEPGSKQPIPDPLIEQLILHHAKAQGIERRAFTAEEIQMRLLAVLANEGARLVEEGVALRDSDVDVVQINGYGFPRWRGGPMFEATAIGSAAMNKTLQDVSRQSPSSWTLADRFR